MEYSIGNTLWEFTSDKTNFDSVDEAWDYLSDAFARSRTTNPDREFKVYLKVYRTNEFGFSEWTKCKEGFAKIINK